MTTQATQAQGSVHPPSGWVETTLGTMINISSGKSRPQNKGQFPVYGGNGVLDYANDFNYEDETIIIGRVGAYCGCVYFEKEKFWLSDNALGIKSNEKSDIKFLYYFLVNLNLNKKAIGGAQPLLTQEILNGIEVNFPPLPEQRAIAGVLSAFDDKIELLREQNKTLEASAQAIFGEWFGKYSPDRPEDLPEGWRVGKIGEIIQRFSIPYKCTKSDLEPKGKTKIFDQGTSGLYGYTSRQPDFEASKENPVILFTNHTCNYWFVDYSFCAIQNVIPYRGKDNYDVYFLYFMTKGSIEFIEYKGHWPDFEAKDFIIPPANLAEKFSKFSKPILEKISENNSQIQTLSTFRDTLLPRLMRGEVRVGF